MEIRPADFLICGGGIIGLTIARELVLRGHENIVIIEKEDAPGMHASGRNSGVLHSGIYYTPESLKARVCLTGNLLMKDYCREKNLPLLEKGKVVVASDDKQVETLREIYKRALKNGALVELIDERQLSEIEPNAKTAGSALYVKQTAVVEPKAIVKSLYADLLSSKKVRTITGCRLQGLSGSKTAITNMGQINFGSFINAAGAYSDRVAHIFGVGLNYKHIPFKGIYWKLIPSKSQMVNGNIYPVPDIRNPFLGVHFTRAISGDVYIGPTAIPVLGRENYKWFEGVDIEAFGIIYREVVLFLLDPKFREVALTEPKKYIFKFFFESARRLVKELDPEDIEPSEKSGIRPQLLDWNTKELIMDFLIIKDGTSLHILNSISPAFTSSMAFARYLTTEYIEK